MPTKIEKDALSGRETTGHDWDGVRELNTPLPKWWLYVFLATIAVGGVLVVLFPSFPGLTGYFKGTLGYSSRRTVDANVAEMVAQRAPVMAKIAAMEPGDIRKDPELLSIALIAGKSTFANNCQPCHGAAGQGRKGYPMLAGDSWIWGGKLEDIIQTVTYGIRSAHPNARTSDMPRFGTDQVLDKASIDLVANYVFATFYGGTSTADLKAGAELFADNCAACHGDKGEGNRDVGGPRLASRIHLYGGDLATIEAQVTQPHEGVMPAWTGRLDPATIKSVALYVHSLGGGE